MANIPGTNVASMIAPYTTDDKIATHDAQYGKGGFRSVETVAERDAISTERKTKGMVVAVTATGLNYQWNGTAWVEWLPKGNVTVDQSLNKASSNAVSNKAVTTAINDLSQDLNDTKELANAALPITQVLATMPSTPDDTTVNTVSTKGIKTYVDNANSAQDTKITANTTAAANAKSAADAAQTTANSAKEVADDIAANAFLKSNIDASTGTTPVTTPVDTRVPSTKYFHTVLTSEKTALNASIAAAKKEGTEAKTAASNAQTTANNAIPKAKIATGFDDTTTADHTYVPSAKLTNEYLNNIDGQINELRTDVDNKIPFSDKTNTITNSASVKVATEKAVKNYVDTQVKTATDASTAVGTRVTALETWKKDVGPRNDANGYAGLDANSKIPASLLPAGYDNVDMLVNFVSAAPTSGMTAGQKWYITGTKKIFTATSATTGDSKDPEDEKIYINIATNKSYRWAGTSSGMVVVGDGSGVALGTTSSTAFRGDQGKQLWDDFGTTANRTPTQEARDFFKAIDVAGDGAIQTIQANQSATEVVLYYFGHTFDGVESEAATKIIAANETYGGIMTAAMFRTLQEIELATFPLSLTLSGPSTYEKGSSTTTAIAISVVRKGTNVTASSTVVVTPPSGVTGTLASNKASWTPSAAIKSNATITVKVVYGAQTVTKTISYTFKLKKYWGVSAKATLTNADVLALSSGWADSRAMSATSFNCSGGKYPYYVIPASLYPGLEVWVGGLRNTDLVVTDMNVTNASGSTDAYKVVRLGNIQTSRDISIQFK